MIKVEVEFHYPRWRTERIKAVEMAVPILLKDQKEKKIKRDG